jgi:hypothetical protein
MYVTPQLQRVQICMYKGNKVNRPERKLEAKVKQSIRTLSLYNTYIEYSEAQFT